MLDVINNIREIISDYIEELHKIAIKDKSNSKENIHLQNICLLINTVDYCKESIERMQELFERIVDSPYDQSSGLSIFEDLCKKRCLDFINQLVQFYERQTDSLFVVWIRQAMLEKGVEVVIPDTTISAISDQFHQFKEKVNTLIQSQIYVNKVMRSSGEHSINRLVDFVSKQKKISMSGSKRTIDGLLISLNIS